MNARDIVRRPLLTEKATIIREIANEYAFEVASGANKIQIKSAVEDLFDVKVLSVRTVSVTGKIKRMGVHQGKRPNWKKAYVKLAEGNSLELFDQM